MKKLKFLLAASLLIGSTDARGEEVYIPKQTFQQYIDLCEKLGQEIEIVESEQQKKEYIKSFEAEITAYTNGRESTGKSPGHPTYGITASGVKTRPNHTISASRGLPFGTKVKINGLSHTYVVEDRGGAIKGNKIDLYVETLDEALEWGRQKRKVYIIEMGDN